MSAARTIVELPMPGDLETAIDDAIRVSGGDPRAAIGALILGQRSLQDSVTPHVSAGYVRRKPDA